MKRKSLKKCITGLHSKNGKLYFKLKKTKGCESAQEVLDSVKTNKIIVK